MAVTQYHHGHHVDNRGMFSMFVCHPRLLDLIPNESYEQRLGGLREQLRKLGGQAGQYGTVGLIALGNTVIHAYFGVRDVLLTQLVKKRPSKTIRNQLGKEFSSTSGVLELPILRENRCLLIPG